MSSPILVQPDQDKPCQLKVDASGFASGGELCQEGKDGKFHPVGFISSSFSQAERNYNVHNHELLAIICGLEEWQHLLEGAKLKLEIWTDHRNLEYFATTQKLNQQQA